MVLNYGKRTYPGKPGFSRNDDSAITFCRNINVNKYIPGDIFKCISFYLLNRRVNKEQPVN